MHGVLWKWLLFLGFVLWSALCIHEYYRKNIEKHPQYYEHHTDEYNDVFIVKKEPPALTFWKTVSMILSVGALIYIKRSSNLITRYSRANFLLSCAKSEPSTRLFNTLAVYPPSVNYIKEFKNDTLLSDFLSNADSKKTMNTSPKEAIYTGLAGVEIIQKKLDNLEKSVATLKQRHIGSFGPGIVSGSPEFRKFLSLCQNTKTTSDDDSTSSLLDLPASHLVSSSTSTNNQFINEVVEIEKPPPTLVNSVVVIKNQSEGEQSWSTISEEETGTNYEKSQELISNKSTVDIEEILLLNKSFSQNSTSTNNKSIHSLLIEHFVDDDIVEVPGSNLLPSGASSSTTTTLMSSSSNQITSLFNDFTSSEEDDDVLYTLD